MQEITKEEAVAALRAAAWPQASKESACGHPGCTEHPGEGTLRIHCRGSVTGADWDLGEAIAEVERATRIAWIPNVFEHELAIKVDNQVWRFDAQQAKHGAEATRDGAEAHLHDHGMPTNY